MYVKKALSYVVLLQCCWLDALGVRRLREG